jgi:hypothetical protein
MLKVITIDYEIDEEVILLTEHNQLLFGIIRDYHLKNCKSKFGYMINTYFDNKRKKYNTIVNSSLLNLKIFKNADIELAKEELSKIL